MQTRLPVDHDNGENFFLVDDETRQRWANGVVISVRDQAAFLIWEQTDEGRAAMLRLRRRWEREAIDRVMRSEPRHSTAVARETLDALYFEAAGAQYELESIVRDQIELGDYFNELALGRRSPFAPGGGVTWPPGYDRARAIVEIEASTKVHGDLKSRSDGYVAGALLGALEQRFREQIKVRHDADTREQNTRTETRRSVGQHDPGATSGGLPASPISADLSRSKVGDTRPVVGTIKRIQRKVDVKP